MKIVPYIRIIGVCCLVIGLRAPHVEAQVPALPFKIKADGTVDPRELLKLTKQPTATDRITDAELEAVKKQHEIQYGSGFKRTEKPELAPEGNFYANSSLLSDGVNHTVLPKAALMHVPDAFKDRVVDKPVGRLILWPEFYKQNRNWLKTREITFENAKGELPLTEEEWQTVQNLGAIVVSVMGGHPISLLEPVTPPATAVVAAEPGKGKAEPAKAVAGKPAVAAAPVATPKNAVAAANSGAEAKKTEEKPTSAPSRFDTSGRFTPRNRK